MTLLSRKADYALLILSYLHRKPAGGTAKAVADRFELSRPFVANILKELCQKGFVASHRGVKGGYTLLRPPATVSLAELLESIEEGFQLTACSPAESPAADACSHASVCTLKGPIAEVHRRLIGVLRGVTLADLFDHDQPKPAAFPALTVLASAGGSCCGSGSRAVEPTSA